MITHSLHRQLAICSLPELLFLDSKRVSGEERLEAVKRAHFIAFTIKPTEDQVHAVC